MHPEPNKVKAVIVDQQRNIVEDTQTIMSDGSASNAPDAASEEDAMMQHAMTLIEDDENGTIPKILQHAGVVHPLNTQWFMLIRSACHPSARSA